MGISIFTPNCLIPDHFTSIISFLYQFTPIIILYIIGTINLEK